MEERERDWDEEEEEREWEGRGRNWVSDHGGESVMDYSCIDLFLAGNNIPHRRFLGWYGMEWEFINWLVNSL